MLTRQIIKDLQDKGITEHADIAVALASNPDNFNEQRFDLRRLIGRLITFGITPKAANDVLLPVIKRLAEDNILIQQGLTALTAGKEVDFGDIVLRSGLVLGVATEPQATRDAVNGLLAAIPLDPPPPSEQDVADFIEADAVLQAEEAAAAQSAEEQRLRDEERQAMQTEWWELYNTHISSVLDDPETVPTKELVLAGLERLKTAWNNPEPEA